MLSWTDLKFVSFFSKDFGGKWKTISYGCSLSDGLLFCSHNRHKSSVARLLYKDITATVVFRDDDFFSLSWDASGWQVLLRHLLYIASWLIVSMLVVWWNHNHCACASCLYRTHNNDKLCIPNFWVILALDLSLQTCAMTLGVWCWSLKISL